MKLVRSTIALSTLAFALSTGAAFAQDHHDDHGGPQHDNNHYVQHNDWKKGHRMDHNDWDRGERINDYGSRHLPPPRRGYEWRQVDGNYVMAAVATGVIASVIAANAGR